MDHIHKGSATANKAPFLMKNKFILSDKTCTIVTIEKGEIVVSISKRRPIGLFTVPDGAARTRVRLSLPEFQKLIDQVPSMAEVMIKLRKSSKNFTQRQSIVKPSTFLHNSGAMAACEPQKYHKNTTLNQQASGNSVSAPTPRKTILLDALPVVQKRRGRPSKKY